MLLKNVQDDSGNWADIRNARVYTDGDVYIEEVDDEGIYECFFTIKSNDTTVHSGHRITFRGERRDDVSPFSSKWFLVVNQFPFICSIYALPKSKRSF